MVLKRGKTFLAQRCVAATFDLFALVFSTASSCAGAYAMSLRLLVLVCFITCLYSAVPRLLAVPGCCSWFHHLLFRFQIPFLASHASSPSRLAVVDSTCVICVHARRLPCTSTFLRIVNVVRESPRDDFWLVLLTSCFSFFTRGCLFVYHVVSGFLHACAVCC